MKRFPTFSVVVSFLIIAAIVFFGSRWFSEKPPDIVLPGEFAPSSMVTDAPVTVTAAPSNNPILIELTVSNVKEILKNINRPSVYTCSYSCTYYWTAGYSDVSIDCAKNNHAFRVNRADKNGVSNSASDGLYLYQWRDNNNSTVSLLGDRNFDDISMIPPYEDILDMTKISSVGYIDGYIYVETNEGLYSAKYWLDSQIGMLAKAEFYQDENMIMKLQLGSFSTDTPDENLFNIPGVGSIVN